MDVCENDGSLQVPLPLRFVDFSLHESQRRVVSRSHHPPGSFAEGGLLGACRMSHVTRLSARDAQWGDVWPYINKELKKG